VKFIYIPASPQRDLVVGNKEEQRDQTPSEEEEMNSHGSVVHRHQFKASRCALHHCAQSGRNPLQKRRSLET